MPPEPLPSAELEAVAALTPFEHLRDARIFLTGGTGFFGHWLLESLLHANRARGLGLQVTALTRSAAAFRARATHITNDPAVALLEGDIATFPFPSGPHHSHILHAATDSVVRTTEADLAASIVAGTRRILDYAAATGARRLLYVSSGAVYGRNITDVATIPETYPQPNAPGAPQNYDEAKRASEALCLAAPLTVSIARCFAFTGPHLPLDAHFAIGNFIRDALASRTICIRGDGAPLRSFLYMSDLAIWLWTLLATAPTQTVVNIGSDEAASIAQLAHLVAATLAPGLPVQIAGTATAGTPPSTYVPDITRAAALGLRVTVPLPEAIRRTARWHGWQSSETRPAKSMASD